MLRNIRTTGHDSVYASVDPPEHVVARLLQRNGCRGLLFFSRTVSISHRAHPRYHNMWKTPETLIRKEKNIERVSEILTRGR